MFEKIRSIIADQLGVDNVEELTLETSLKENIKDFFIVFRGYVK
jgi:acyl carrier protein